jgi:hypothetical protein
MAAQSVAKVVMIALVGDQTQPNLLPLRHRRPDAAVLVYTNRTKVAYERLSAVLGNETRVIGLQTDAYAIPDIERDLIAQLATQELQLHQLEFNLTGGTKAMSLAALAVARRHLAPVLYLESEGGRSVLHRYLWQDDRLKPDPHAPQAVLAPLISIRDLLDIAYGRNQWGWKPPRDDVGGRFEQAIIEALASPAVDELVSGITALDNLEIDVLVRCGNQFAIVEAKVGKSGRTLDAVKQLTMAWRTLGTYVQTISVTSTETNQIQQALREVGRIVPVALTGYDPQTGQLPPADATQLVQVVRQQLIGQPQRSQ